MVQIELLGHDPIVDAISVFLRVIDPPAGARLLEVAAFDALGNEIGSGYGKETPSGIVDAFVVIHTIARVHSIGARFIFVPQGEDGYAPVPFEGSPWVKKKLVVTFDGPVHSSSKGDSFHKPTCSKTRSLKPKNLEVYATAQEAIDAFKLPCMKCLEQEHDWVVEL